MSTPPTNADDIAFRNAARATARAVLEAADVMGMPVQNNLLFATFAGMMNAHPSSSSAASSSSSAAVRPVFGPPPPPTKVVSMECYLCQLDVEDRPPYVRTVRDARVAEDDRKILQQPYGKLRTHARLLKRFRKCVICDAKVCELHCRAVCAPKTHSSQRALHGPAVVKIRRTGRSICITCIDQPILNGWMNEYKYACERLDKFNWRRLLLRQLFRSLVERVIRLRRLSEVLPCFGIPQLIDSYVKIPPPKKRKRSIGGHGCTEQ